MIVERRHEQYFLMVAPNVGSRSKESTVKIVTCSDTAVVYKLDTPLVCGSRVCFFAVERRKNHFEYFPTLPQAKRVAECLA